LIKKVRKKEENAVVRRNKILVKVCCVMKRLATMNFWKEMLLNNLWTIVVTLIAIGGFIALVHTQGSAIAANTTAISCNADKIITLEKNAIRMEAIQNDIAEIKSDIKEIKHIVLKPAIVRTSEKTYNDLQIVANVK